MKITMNINIPKELEKDFSDDRFKEFFERVCADMSGNGCCGRYERETAEMLKDAFQEAEISSEDAAQEKDKTNVIVCRAYIKCAKDPVIPEDSRCANCCIYCDEADCVYRCKEADELGIEESIEENCRYAY